MEWHEASRADDPTDFAISLLKHSLEVAMLLISHNQKIRREQKNRSLNCCHVIGHVVTFLLLERVNIINWG